MMNEVTISTHNGSQVAREHNRRNPRVILKEDHIDPNGHFEVWVDEDPKEAYCRIFGQAVEEYNSRQTREERKIDDYYDKICQDDKKHPVYEMIVGIYGRNPDGSPVCSKAEGRNILRAFVDDWKRRNPNLELIGAYYHADEEGQPHVHLDYIPVARGYSKGMAVQTAISKALQQQGFMPQGQQTEQMQWQARENQHLGSLCSIRGLTVLHPGSKAHLETAVFKAEKHLAEMQQEDAALTQAIAEKTKELEAAQDALASLRDRKSLSEVVMGVAYQTDRQIEVEFIPAKKRTLTKPAEPAKVLLLEEDYLDLRERALASSLIRTAHDKLKDLGNELIRRLERSKRFMDLQQRATDAELDARNARLELDYARAEISQLKTEIGQQQDFMTQTKASRDGRTIWDFFIQAITKERERELLDEVSRGYGE
jgi:hypothetical protein